MRRDPELQQAIERRRIAQANRSSGILRKPVLAVSVLGLLIAAGVAVVAQQSRSDGTRTEAVPAGLNVVAQPVRLLETPDDAPVDGTAGATTSLTSDATIEIDVAEQVADVDASSIVVLDVTAVGGTEAGSLRIFECGTAAPELSSLLYEPGATSATQVITPLGSGKVCVVADADVEVALEFRAALPEGMFVATHQRLLDTRPEQSGEDALVRSEPLASGEEIEIPMGDLDDSESIPDGAGLLLTVTGSSDGDVTVSSCGPERPHPAMIAGDQRATTVIEPHGDDSTARAVCVHSTGEADIAVDLVGWFAPAAVDTPPGGVRLVDTHPDGVTMDGHVQAQGRRPADSTLDLQVAGRAGVAEGAVAAIIRLRTDEMNAPGSVAVFASANPTAVEQAVAPMANVVSEGSGTMVAPLGPGGRLCVHNTEPTHLTVDVLGWFVPPAGATETATNTDVDDSTMSTIDAADSTPASDDVAIGCGGQTLFPKYRMVAMYGTQRSATLGVLGEQAPEAAAKRLEKIVESWLGDDRPVLPAFELITVLATADDGDEGNYNLAASDEFVQEYLDTARRHGFYLILDLQPGRSDFLTEAKRYEKFLRQPDVGLALDPEWRTPPPERPRGGHVGHVTADEVNAVSEWLAGIVEEERLPEKLLVVHQFQEQMIRNREQLVEPPGIALTIHMDGLGTRAQKLDTYSYVHAKPPLNNGLKLFYDEDVDMYTPAEVLDGVFDPMPDLITYQ